MNKMVGPIGFWQAHFRVPTCQAADSHWLLSAPLTPYKCVRNLTFVHLFQGKGIDESMGTMCGSIAFCTYLGGLSWEWGNCHELHLPSVSPSEQEQELPISSDFLHKACLLREDRCTCISYSFRASYHILKRGSSIHWRVKTMFSFLSDDS